MNLKDFHRARKRVEVSVGDSVRIIREHPFDFKGEPSWPPPSESLPRNQLLGATAEVNSDPLLFLAVQWKPDRQWTMYGKSTS